MRRASLIPTALMCVATVAFPCGGSNSYNVDGPLWSAASFAERAISPLYDFESITRDEVRWLPGLLRADSARFAGLLGRQPLQSQWWDTVTKPVVAAPTRAAIVAAWARGDVAGAERAARAAVATIMALPASDDPARDSLLRLAVETVELVPEVARSAAATPASRQARFDQLAAPWRRLSVDSLAIAARRQPMSARQPTLEYAALRVAMRDGLPNDTREEITKQVPAAGWDSLHRAHHEWLTRHANHPYAGLVKFSRLRLFFLGSQVDSTWSTALALLPEYPVRAAAEMRYLLVVGFPKPAWLLESSAVPMAVRVALVGNLIPSPMAWRALRAHAAQAPSLASPAIEERLLTALATSPDTLGRAIRSAELPAWRSDASPYWRYMWAVTRLQRGELDEAARFAATPVTPAQDSLLAGEATMLTARIHMMRGAWARAVETPQLDEWTRRYILRVLAPDSVATMLVGSANRAVARDARLLLATRTAKGGQWAEAATLVRPVDAARAARYVALGAQSRDTLTNVGLLRFARSLAAAHGALHFESTRYFYRGMMYRTYALLPNPDRTTTEWDLPWTREHELERMFAHLRDGSERLQSLRAYAAYFGRPGVSAAERRVAVREADKVYRALLDTDPANSTSGYWGDSLPRSDVARAIRRAGRSGD